MALHDLNAFHWFDGSDEDRGSDSRRLAYDIEHEVRAIVEKNVRVAWSQIHRANAWSRAPEMMTCGITGWIRFGFDNTAAQAALG